MKIECTKKEWLSLHSIFINMGYETCESYNFPNGECFIYDYSNEKDDNDVELIRIEIKFIKKGNYEH